MLLSKAEILGKQDRAFADIDVPAWGGQVRIAALSTAQVFEFQGIQRESSDRALGFLLVRAIVDEQFQQLFGDDEIDKLLQKSFAATELLMNKALELNNLSKKAEEAKKNSLEDQSDASLAA